MESLDTMLSDAVSISALLSYTDTTKYHKFRQLKKQMSNISTPSPAASPEPILESEVISQTVLKTINHPVGGDEEQPDKSDSDQLDTPVTLGEEFFSSSLSVSSSLASSSSTCLVQTQTATELTKLSPPGKIHLSLPSYHAQVFSLPSCLSLAGDLECFLCIISRISGIKNRVEKIEFRSCVIGRLRYLHQKYLSVSAWLPPLPPSPPHLNTNCTTILWASGATSVCVLVPL